MGFHAGRLMKRPLPLHIIIESPTALNRLTEICQCGTRDLVNLKLETVTMGSDDYLAAIGITPLNKDTSLLETLHCAPIDTSRIKTPREGFCLFGTILIVNSFSTNSPELLHH